MKKNRIQSYNSKYVNELKMAIKQVLPLLKEAFIKFYGEQYREYINYRIDNLNFIFFVSRCQLEVLRMLQKGVSSKYRRIAKDYLCNLNYLDYLYKSVSEEEQERFITDNYVLWSNLERKYIDGYVYDILAEDTSLATDFLRFNGDNIEACKLVQLPIITGDFRMLVHEINHTLVIKTVGYTEEEIICSRLFKLLEVEELVNDFCAAKVCDIFISLGGVVPLALRRFNLKSLYEEDLWLVEDLFLDLGEEVKMGLITGNHNRFRYMVGESNISKYEEKVQELYWNYDTRGEVKEELQNMTSFMGQEVMRKRVR